MSSNRRKVALLIIGLMLIFGFVGNNLNTRLTDESQRSFWNLNNNGDNGVVETTLIKGAADKIAIINVDGVIIDNSELGTLFSSSANSSANQIVSQIDRAEKDPRVKAIILKINSPGGTAVAGQTITERLGEFVKSGKGYYVAMREVAASAAYEIATPANKIFANPETQTGSIGVMMQLSNYRRLYDKIGIEDVVIKSGEKKDMGSSSRIMTEEERGILQTMVNESYNNFVATVAKWRKMDENKVRELGDGRVYTARQAKDSGLIDEIGNLPAVIEEASRGIGVADPTVIEYTMGAFGGIIGSIFQKVGYSNAVLEFISKDTINSSFSNQLMHLWVPN